MTAHLTTLFVGGWGSTDEVWRPTLAQIPGVEAHYLNWLDCVKDWPRALTSTISVLPGKCLLIGWSLGSLLSLRAAVELPEKVAALVLVSATPRMCADVHHHGTNARSLAAMQARLSRNREAVLLDFARNCIAPDGDADVCLQFLQQARQYCAEDLAMGLDCLATLDLREILTAIKVPCSLLHGSSDRIVPLENAQFLSQKLPVADLAILEGCGHALPLTAPTEVARLIRRAVS